MGIEVVWGSARLNGKILDNDFIYVSDGTWYDKGTLCRVLINCGEGGALMLGYRNGGLDEEFCSWEEFDIFSSDRKLLMKARDE